MFGLDAGAFVLVVAVSAVFGTLLWRRLPQVAPITNTQDHANHDGRTEAMPDQIETVTELASRWMLRVHDGESFEIMGEMLIGRARDANIRIEDEQVSRVHARLALLDGRVTIVDLDSTNRTFVNGQPVQMAMLEPGDEISFGRKITAKLTLDDESS